jgi:hypothetical protein
MNRNRLFSARCYNAREAASYHAHGPKGHCDLLPRRGRPSRGGVRGRTHTTVSTAPAMARLAVARWSTAWASASGMSTGWTGGGGNRATSRRRGLTEQALASARWRDQLRGQCSPVAAGLWWLVTSAESFERR